MERLPGYDNWKTDPRPLRSDRCHWHYCPACGCTFDCDDAECTAPRETRCLECEWGKPISVYTDRDALEDGTLIDIASLNLTFEGKPVNRITGNLFWEMKPFFPLAGFDASGADDDEELIDFDLEAFARSITTKLTLATGSGRIRNLPPELWLVENELRGWTLMFPSDY